VGIIKAIYLLLRAFLVSRASAWPLRTSPCGNKSSSTSTLPNVPGSGPGTGSSGSGSPGSGPTGDPPWPSSKPLARLHYYATHPQSFYGDPRASADFVGHARERLEAKEGVFQIYFTGCGGDVACGKYNDASRRARDELESRFYAAMEASAPGTKLFPATSLAWRAEAMRLPARTDQGYTEPELRAVTANAKLDPRVRVYAACKLAYLRPASRSRRACWRSVPRRPSWIMLEALARTLTKPAT
jgi:hypothetical protein